MKKIEYSCDRCGAPFSDTFKKVRSIAIQRKKKSFKLLLYKNWMSEEALFKFRCDELDLCVSCRKDFDNWLNGVEVK